MKDPKKFYLYPLLIAILMATAVLGVAIDHWIEITFYSDVYWSRHSNGYRFINFWVWFITALLAGLGAYNYFQQE